MSLHVQRFGDRSITRDLPVLPQCLRGEEDLRPYAGLIPFLKEMRALAVEERLEMPALISAAMWRFSNGLGFSLSVRDAKLVLSIKFRDRTLTLTTPDSFLISTSNRRPDADLSTSLVGCIDLALLLLEAGQAEPEQLRLRLEEYHTRRNAIALHVKSVNPVDISSVTVLPPSPVCDELKVVASSARDERFASAEVRPEHDLWMPIRVMSFTCEMTASELKLGINPHPIDVTVSFESDPVSILRLVNKASQVKLEDAPPLFIPDTEWEFTW